MTDRHLSQEPQADARLTGFWTGVFDTADLSFEATPFHAFLHEQGGRLAGEAVEPNGFSPDPVTELFASLEGWRDGPEVEFLKTYEDALGAGFTMRFEGCVSSCGDRINGVWTLLDVMSSAIGGAGRGPFVMNRAEAATDPGWGAAARSGED